MGEEARQARQQRYCSSPARTMFSRAGVGVGWLSSHQSRSPLHGAMSGIGHSPSCVAVRPRSHDCVGDRTDDAPTSICTFCGNLAAHAMRRRRYGGLASKEALESESSRSPIGKLNREPVPDAPTRAPVLSLCTQTHRRRAVPLIFFYSDAQGDLLAFRSGAWPQCRNRWR